MQRVEEKRSTPAKQPTLVNPDSSSGTMNFAELRDVKVKLSRKEKELKDLQEQLDQALHKVVLKEEEIAFLTKERDNLRLKNEIITECLQKNNVQIDSAFDTNGNTLSLIDEYKERIARMEKELEKRDKELSEKNKRIAELQIQSQREEDILRKHLEENQRLKRQMKKMEESSSPFNLASSPPPSTKHSTNPKLKLNLQAINGDQHNRRKSQLDGLVLPDLNEKFINNLSNQLESLFATGQEEEVPGSSRSLKSGRMQDVPDDPMRLNSCDNIVSHALQDQSHLPEDDNQIHMPSIEEKEKILETVKNSALQMQNELMELMKNEYEKRIQEIEKEKLRLDNERQETMRKVSSNDSKQAQVIDQQYKSKMEDLAKQLQTLKDKEKKQEQVEKQYQIKVQKIKALEDDILKMKKKEEDMEKQRKNESEKFSKYKQTISKELTQAKKTVVEKEKVVQKLKIDLKKIDQFAQKKLSELKGFQKKIMEERLKKEQEKKEEYESKGIDIDRIKDWINENTQRMLDHRELKEQLEEQVEKKERIEDEMIQEEEKLTTLMMQKELIDAEYQQLCIEDPPDEGRIMELEEEIYQKTQSIQNITDALDSLDETLTFVSKKINVLTEEVTALDIDNIAPLKFSGLQSVDAARVTLQTFFGVLLDINVYKRDLEMKCIDQDEAILGLNEKIRALQARVEELMIAQGQKIDPSGNTEQNRINSLSKDKALKNIVEDVKNLHLTPNEQNSLTKLSLSKIVSNLKQKLKEEETKNQNLSHKLESAINDKEQYKLKYDNLRKQNKNEKILKEPLQFKEQQQQDKEQKFSSLAAARERRRQGQQSISNANQLDSSELDISTIAKPQVATSQSSLQQKFRSKLQQSRPGTSMDETNTKIRNGGRDNMSSQLSFRTGGTNHAPKKSIGGMGNNTARNNQPDEGSEVQKPTYTRRSPKKVESMKISQHELQSQLSGNMQRKQLMPIQEYKTPQPPKPIPSLKDRRNQRKLENDDDGVKVEPEKVLEIEKIKEETLLITQGQAHKERRQSRIRDFTKRGFSNNKNQFQANLYQQYQDSDLNTEDMGQNRNNFQNIKIAVDDTFSNTPKGDNNSSQGFKLAINKLEIESNSESDIQEQLMSPSKDVRNKWSYEELAQVDSTGQRLIGCNYADGKIFLIFEDFSIRELSIQTLEEVNSINLFQVNGIKDQGERVVDYALDRDLNTIALSSSTTVYIFDYQDNYRYLTKVEVENIVQVLFCNFNIIVLVNTDECAYVVAYQIEEEPIEIGSYQINHEGYLTMIRTDNQFVYFSSGIKLGKLLPPDMNPQYIVETEHSDIIINFNISKYAIITTSKDGSLRCHDLETGEQNQEQVTDIMCDHLESQDDFIITRCGGASAYLIWKYSPFKTELELIDEIPIEAPEFEVLDYKMKGGILAQFNNGVKYDLVLLVTCVEEGFLVNALKHKPLCEY